MPENNKTIQYLLKHLIDYIAAFGLTIILSPLLLLLSGIVYFTLGGPVFFRQIRSGKNKQPFLLYKFRTMKNNPPGKELSDFERLTPLGSFLRKSSLDELPQLINVLKGEISLVGPRPLLPEYDTLYNNQQKKRLLMRPGITGWAQINGRNSLPWREKFNLDVWYIDHWSLLLDCKILFLTLIKVFTTNGINAGQNITMDKFKGNE